MNHEEKINELLNELLVELGFPRGEKNDYKPPTTCKKFYSRRVFESVLLLDSAEGTA